MGLSEQRKQQLREYSKRYYYEHHEECRVRQHKYYRENFEKERARKHLYAQTHKEQLRAYRKKYAQKYPDKRRMGYEKSQLKLKLEILTHYGNGKCACVRCGESRLACLSLDHIEGGGVKEFKKTGRGGVHLYSKLRQAAFPEGYQTLCMNCQFVKREENNECRRRL